jgi:hypothetical protein
METSPKQTSLFGMAELTSLQADSHASHSAAPDKEKAQTTTATSGRRCVGQYEKLPHATSWAKTLTAYLLGQTVWYSRPCVLTWKMKGTKFKRIAFQLVPRMRRTEGTGGGLLPTVLAVDRAHPDRVEALAATNAQNIYSRANGELRPNGLSDALNFHAMKMDLLPTPTISGNHNRAGLSEKSGDGLATRLQQMLPPPQSRDFRSPDKPESQNFQRKVKEGYTIDLNSAIAMLPTLTVALKEDCPAERRRKTPSVAAQIGMLPTPATRDYKGTNSDEHLGKERGHHDQLPNAMKMSTGLKLQPAFAAWMMGYPEDWTLTPFLLDPNTPPENGEKNPSKATETPSSPKSPTLSSKPSKPPK